MKIKDFIPVLANEKRNPPKPIVKLGTIGINIVETVPVVWQGRLMRFEWIRSRDSCGGNPKNDRGYCYSRFTDMETGEHSPDMAVGNAFTGAFVENGTAYVFGNTGGDNGGGNRLNMFRSNNLSDWDSRVVFDFPADWKLYNVSVCHGSDAYYMAFEIGSPPEIATNSFTVLFARSEDLLDWRILQYPEHTFSREHYTGGPSLHYCGGYYYLFYVQELPYFRFRNYVVRTKDFEEFEVGIKNPITDADDDDRIIFDPSGFTDDERELIRTAININNSDLDFCEYNGRTEILYSWGNQLGTEFLARAVYDGPAEEFMQSLF